MSIAPDGNHPELKVGLRPDVGGSLVGLLGEATASLWDPRSSSANCSRPIPLSLSAALPPGTAASYCRSAHAISASASCVSAGPVVDTPQNCASCSVLVKLSQPSRSTRPWSARAYRLCSLLISCEDVLSSSSTRQAC
eukprot:7385127-Prymnesium_polylepis.7